MIVDDDKKIIDLKNKFIRDYINRVIDIKILFFKYVDYRYYLV